MLDHGAKTTIYLSPAVRKALKKRVVDTEQTMSEYVDRAVAIAIAEDLHDIETVQNRRSEPAEPLDDFLAALKRDGRI